MATKEKKVPVLNVGYSDKSGVITVTKPDDDSEVTSLNVREIAGENTPETLILGGIRYFAGYLRDAVSAATKAGKDAVAAVENAVLAVMEGTLQFRERGGEGGLSTEQEFSIIADVLLSLGVVKSKDEALAVIQAKYDVTKEVVTPAKGDKPEKRSTTRPEYRRLKGVAAISEALTKAQKVDSVDELAQLGIKAGE
jgi:hypothetical protein